MNLYELMLIVNPAAGADGQKAVLDQVSEVIGANGEVARVDDLGEKKLAYQINRNAQGHYSVVYLKMGADILPELERRLRLNEQVVRFMVLRRPDDHFEQEKARKERRAAKAEAKAAAARARQEAAAAAEAARAAEAAAQKEAAQKEAAQKEASQKEAAPAAAAPAAAPEQTEEKGEG